MLDIRLKLEKQVVVCTCGEAYQQNFEGHYLHREMRFPQTTYLGIQMSMASKALDFVRGTRKTRLSL